MTINTYQQLAARTINHALDRDEMINHAVFGLSGEVGEISSLFQKVYQGHELNESDLRKEIGDSAWMLAELCTAYGWDMEQVFIENIEKLRARYPKGFSAERSLHREQ
jgi:NTP pyrophosphatase (non-canonical NTP hydrolase)